MFIFDFCISSLRRPTGSPPPVKTKKAQSNFAFSLGEKTLDCAFDLQALTCSTRRSETQWHPTTTIHRPSAKKL
jgi:hypothetical protein